DERERENLINSLASRERGYSGGYAFRDHVGTSGYSERGYTQSSRPGRNEFGRTEFGRNVYSDRDSRRRNDRRRDYDR
ncbi:MAG: hypothetical protein II884_11130, partial [Synergistaceae bacterium]|nr:hypothetical protein [Synergistaceae bacterium]